MSQNDIAAYCHQKGIYPEQLVAWRSACEQANDWSQTSEKELKEATQGERKKNKQLQKELYQQARNEHPERWSGKPVTGRAMKRLR